MDRHLTAQERQSEKLIAHPAKADKAKQKSFITAYNKLKKEVGNKEPIYCVDSAHPEHQTRLSYGWIAN